MILANEQSRVSSELKAHHLAGEGEKEEGAEWKEKEVKWHNQQMYITIDLIN